MFKIFGLVPVNWFVHAEKKKPKHSDNYMAKKLIAAENEFHKKQEQKKIKAKSIQSTPLTKKDVYKSKRQCGVINPNIVLPETALVQVRNARDETQLQLQNTADALANEKAAPNPNETFVANLEKNVKDLKRKLVGLELIETELTFYKGTLDLEEAILKLNQFPQTTEEQGTLTKAFLFLQNFNISEQAFIKDLQKEISSGAPKFDALLERHGNHFKLFTKVPAYQSDLNPILSRPDIAKYTKENSLQFSSQLISFIQRLPRIKLMIEDYQKKSNIPQDQMFAKAVEIADNNVWAVDSSTTENNQHQMFKLFRKHRNSKSFFSPNLKLKSELNRLGNDRAFSTVSEIINYKPKVDENSQQPAHHVKTDSFVLYVMRKYKSAIMKGYAAPTNSEQAKLLLAQIEKDIPEIEKLYAKISGFAYDSKDRDMLKKYTNELFELKAKLTVYITQNEEIEPIKAKAHDLFTAEVKDADRMMIFKMVLKSRIRKLEQSEIDQSANVQPLKHIYNELDTMLKKMNKPTSTKDISNKIIEIQKKKDAVLNQFKVTSELKDSREQLLILKKEASDLLQWIRDMKALLINTKKLAELENCESDLKHMKTLINTLTMDRPRSGSRNRSSSK